MLRARLFLAILAATALLAPARAATEERPSKLGFGIRLGVFEPTNSEESYELVYDDPGFLAGLEGFWKHRKGLGIELSGAAFMKDGEGVRLVDGKFVKTGSKRELLIVPVLVSVKYHLLHGRPFSPYFGGGLGIWYLEEKNVSAGKRFTSTTGGAHFVGGAELLANKRVSILAELEYSSVPDAIGQNPDSTSSFFGETDIGGLGFHVKTHINF